MTKLIKIYKQNCDPCAKVDGFLKDLEVEYESFDIMENTTLAAQYGIMSVPVTILVDDNGNEISRSIGYKPNELENLISQL